MRVYFFLLILIIQSPILSQNYYKTSWEKDGLITGIGIINLGGSLYLYNQVKGMDTINSYLNRSEVNWFDRSTTYNWSQNAKDISDYFLYLCLVSPMVLFTSKDVNKDFKDISIMYLQTFLSTISLTMYAKSIVQRPRPFAYNPDVPGVYKADPDAARSFFSGHASTTFASSVFLSTIYSKYFSNSKYKPYVIGLSLLLASATSYLRYESGMHFPSDIITGALVGGSIGYLIPLIHETNEKDKDPIPKAYGFQVTIPF